MNMFRKFEKITIFHLLLLSTRSLFFPQKCFDFNTAHFHIQYCTPFNQYSTKCAILNAKIGPESVLDKLEK